MWIRTYSKTFQRVKKESLWKILTDINNWARWHDDIDYCKIEEPFAEGSSFVLKPKGMKAVEIELTEVEEGTKFTDCTSFFGAKMCVTHRIIEMKSGIQLKFILKVTGPLRWFWIKLVAQNVARSIPDEMETLVSLARSHEK